MSTENILVDEYQAQALSSAPDMQGVKFESVPLQISSKSGLREDVTGFGPLSRLGSALCCVALRFDSYHRVVGTAFMVAPGIIVSCKHIFWDDIHAIFESGYPELSFISFAQDGRIHFWRKPRFQLSLDSEIAIFTPQYRSEIVSNVLRLEYLRVSAKPPKVGDEVLILGVRQANSDTPAENVRLTGYGAKAKVVELHPLGIKPFLPGPGFSIDCHCKDSMSGGPVLDATGRVIGAISSSMEFLDGGGLTRVSFLAPALSRNTIQNWPTEKSERPLAELLPYSIPMLAN